MVLIGVISLIVFLVLGMPVAFALGVAGSIGIIFDQGFATLLSILTMTPFRTAAHYSLITIPMFVLMAEFITYSGAAKDIYKATYRWVGHMPGGLAVASILACAGMGAMSGSSTATAAAMSNVAIPEMDRYGYKRELSSGAVAIAGTLAILIPPSISLVVYGIQTETSIGQLLIAGIVPGLMTTLTFAIGVVIWVKLRPDIAPVVQPFSWRERIESLRGIWSIIVLFTLVIGSIYGGIATPTEAAAIGALGSWIILCVISRKNVLEFTIKAAYKTIMVTAMIFTIIIGAMIFGYFLTLSGAVQALLQTLIASAIPTWGIMVILIIFYLIMGCFMDQIAILLLTLPLTFPLVMQLGYNPVWFGIIMCKLVAIGMITPPLGMNVFIVSSSSKIPITTVFRGVLVFLAIDIINITLLFLFPQISLWLPSLMN